MQPRQQRADIAPRIAVDRLPLKQARQMAVLKLLPGVYQSRTLEEIQERRVIHEIALPLHGRAYARLVVVFKEA